MKLKIGIVCPYNIYRPGGVQEAIFAHRKYLMQKGHEVFIIAPKVKHVFNQEQANVIEIGKAKQIRTPFKTTADFSYQAEKSEITKLLAQIKFDVLHFHEPWVPVLSKQILNEAKKQNIKTVATFHASLPEGVTAKTIKTIIRPYAKPTIPKIDSLVAVSDAAAKNIKSLTKRDIKIIPNAIDSSLYNPQKIEAHILTQGDVPTILYIGRLETRKGVEYLIRAVARLNKTSDIKPRLIIAGDGPQKDKLTQLAYNKGIYDIHFLGFVSLEDKLQLLKGCDVFCSPALYGESFGIVLLEAMSMGKPVIAGDNDGYRGVLINEGSQGLINPKDIDSFVGLIKKFVTDKLFVEKLIKWGKNEVKQYDYHIVVDKYEELYRALVMDKQ